MQTLHILCKRLEHAQVLAVCVLGLTLVDTEGRARAHPDDECVPFKTLFQITFFVPQD